MSFFQPVIALKTSTDWMKPIHQRTVSFTSAQLTVDVNHIYKKIFLEQQLQKFVFGEIACYDLVKLTHKINHHRFDTDELIMSPVH